MTRFVVYTSAVPHLATTGVEVPGVHKLLRMRPLAQLRQGTSECLAAR